GTAGSPELVWSDPLFPPTVRSLSDEPLPFVGVGAGNPASVITAEAVPGVPIHQQILELAAENGLAFASIRISGTFITVSYSVAHNLLKQGTPLTDPTVDKAPYQLSFTDEASAEWELSGFYVAGASVQELVSVRGAPVHLHGFRNDRSRAGHVGSAIVENATIQLYPLEAPVVREADLTLREMGVSDGVISFEVFNAGHGTVTGTTVQVVIAGDVVFQVKLADLRHEVRQVVTMAIPAGIDPNLLVIVVDPFNEVRESDESNNVSFKREGLFFHLADKLPTE
ncbi:MAG: hypothetical protein ACI9OJ_002256, partial [Myxococcota bacterium]